MTATQTGLYRVLSLIYTMHLYPDISKGLGGSSNKIAMDEMDMSLQTLSVLPLSAMWI